MLGRHFLIGTLQFSRRSATSNYSAAIPSYCGIETSKLPGSYT